MSRTIPVPGSGRITLALLAVVPAVMAYPWRTPREQWVLGIAVAVVILLFGWWGGLHFTTILRRRLAMMGRSDAELETGSSARTTALLRLGPPASDQEVLPLPLIAGYLNCYGIRADTIRITSRTTAADACQTWIALTVSAADNLAALQARSSRIPLRQTTQVAVRRLADHLREIGWEATVVEPDVVPRLLDSAGRRVVARGAGRLGLPCGISGQRGRCASGDPRRDPCRSRRARRGPPWRSPAGSGASHTVAVACALLTDEPPSAATPLAGLTPQRGNQQPALAALDLLSTQRLDGHTSVPDDLLTRLDWPTPPAGAHRAPLAEART